MNVDYSAAAIEKSKSQFCTYEILRDLNRLLYWAIVGHGMSINPYGLSPIYINPYDII